MFSKILIANRGEIASRVMSTARSMGIRTVAVFSEQDQTSLHVENADEAMGIGSYLDGPAIIECALQSGAQAIHPGYGFLSENAVFAKAVADAGLIFIGPSVPAIRDMGSIVRSRRIMEKAGVPVVPGYHGAKQDLATFKAAASKIGYPVMIKASAGGGGRGMRIVDSVGQLSEALASAKRESKAAFGDATLLMEKAVQRARHVEVQVFGDRFGNIVALSERDCSVQRRHQKVIEEAPAPGLSPALREDFAAAAISAAAAIGYIGAGTVEFLLAPDDAFYFMEMNTRLQVEHPVTEMIFGEDLVQWQLIVAAGGELPREQDELIPSGHAIEARLYAEDPLRNFLPTGGIVERFRLAEIESYGGAVRIDSAVREGDLVSSEYDPMIAKVVVWGIDRPSAISRMRGVLEDMELAGMQTNLGFLRRAYAHLDFCAGPVDTGFIESNSGDLLSRDDDGWTDALILAALAVMLERECEADKDAKRSGDPYSPWHSTHAWRMNGDNHHELDFSAYIGEQETVFPVTVHYRDKEFFLELPDDAVFANGHFDDDGSLTVDLSDGDNALRIKGMALIKGDRVYVDSGDYPVTFKTGEHGRATDVSGSGSGGLSAPMPGRVVSIAVKVGDSVASGQALMALEAMKMEHTIAAPGDGVVEAIYFKPGDRVDDGAELIKIGNK